MSRQLTKKCATKLRGVNEIYCAKSRTTSDEIFATALTVDDKFIFTQFSRLRLRMSSILALLAL